MSTITHIPSTKKNFRKVAAAYSRAEKRANPIRTPMEDALRALDAICAEHGEAVCEVAHVNAEAVKGFGVTLDYHFGSGLLRGFLCDPINVAVGLLNDCPDVTRKLAQYLQRPLTDYQWFPEWRTTDEGMSYRKGKVCECCGSDKKLCVDHCHETERVRGILCDSCNQAEGRIKRAAKVSQYTTHELADRLADYLERIPAAERELVAKPETAFGKKRPKAVRVSTTKRDVVEDVEDVEQVSSTVGQDNGGRGLWLFVALFVLAMLSIVLFYSG